ncbi:MAG: sigma-70 family RNA polymerase sigma factor [Bryobacteraceae bacterium]
MLQLATGGKTVHSNLAEFSRLFDQYHGMVFRTAYRLTGNAADAEDVLQNIFLRLIRRSPGHQLSDEESYLRRAAVNASLDVLRAKQTSSAVPLDEISVPTKESHANEIRECLRRAFARLSPRAAEIFALRYLEDFTNQQIARTLEISQVLVAVTLHRTRRQLQKEIRSYFEGRL